MANYERAPFKTISEDWNEYETESGITIRVKLVVGKIEIEQDDDGNLVMADSGDPSVRVSIANHITAHQT